MRLRMIQKRRSRQISERGSKMTPSDKRGWTTPRDRNLRLRRIENRSGLSISVLPNGCVFAIEHARKDDVIVVNQLLGSPVDDGATLAG